MGRGRTANGRWNGVLFWRGGIFRARIAVAVACREMFTLIGFSYYTNYTGNYCRFLDLRRVPKQDMPRVWDCLVGMKWDGIV